MHYAVKNVAEITKDEQLSWRSYVESTTLANPLQDFDFIQCLAEFRKINIGVGSDDKGPVVFLPFESNSRNEAFPPAIEISDCSQLIIRPEASLDPKSLVRELGLTSYDFDHLFPTDVCAVENVSYFEDDCFLIDLNEGFDSYVENLKEKKSSIASEVARKSRKLEREIGAIQFDLNSRDEQVLDQLLEWKSNQLDRQGFSHVFRETWCKQFMESHLRSDSLFSRGIMSTLTSGDHLIAIHFGTLGPSCINSWIPIVNPEFSKYSPAAQLYFQLAKRLSDSGVKTIILGRGENQTKRRLSNRLIPNHVGSIRPGFTKQLGFLGKRGLYRFLRSRWGKGIHQSLQKLKRSISRK